MKRTVTYVCQLRKDGAWYLYAVELDEDEFFSLSNHAPWSAYPTKEEAELDEAIFKEHGYQKASRLLTAEIQPNANYGPRHA